MSRKPICGSGRESASDAASVTWPGAASAVQPRCPHHPPTRFSAHDPSPVLPCGSPGFTTQPGWDDFREPATPWAEERKTADGAVLQDRLAASWHRLVNLCVKTTCPSKSRFAEHATCHPDKAARTSEINLSHVGRGPASQANGPASAGWWKRPNPARLSPPRTTPIAHVPCRGTLS